MRSRLNATEPINEQFIDIVTSDLADVEKTIGDGRKDLADRVRRCRRIFQDIRAAIHLARFHSGSGFRREDEFFAELVDMVPRSSTTDDMKLLIDTLREPLTAQLSTGKVTSIRQALHQKPVTFEVSKEEVEERLAEVEGRLPEARQRISEWELEDRGFKSLSKGFRGTYADGRKELEPAFESGEPENVQQFRDLAAHHAHHIVLLSEAWPELLEPRAQFVRRMTEGLESLESIPALKETVRRNPRWFGSSRDRRVLEDFLENEARPFILDRAHAYARRIYAEPAVNITKRIESYWQILVAESR